MNDFELFTRFEHDCSGKELPQSWNDNALDLLNEVFADKFLMFQQKPLLFGRIYSNELLIILSILDARFEDKAPLTCFFSFDVLDDTAKKIPSIINNLVDAMGVILDDYFNHPDEMDYSGSWTHETFGQTTFYLRISRENIESTLKANELLNKKN